MIGGQVFTGSFVIESQAAKSAQPGESFSTTQRRRRSTESFLDSANLTTVKSMACVCAYCKVGVAALAIGFFAHPRLGHRPMGGLAHCGASCSR